MANNEAGAFLNITPDVLKKLDSFDEKLEMIEKHAHTAADALKNGFGSVVMDTSKLESVITSLAKKIDAIKGNPFEGAGKGAEETTRKTTSLNESLSRAADLLNRIGNNKIGEGSFANFNISGLKQGYSDLKKYVENMDLSKPQQKAAVEAMRYMKMELDEQRKTDEQRAQSAEKAAQRKAAADKRAAKEAADLANAQRSTPQGALDYSKNAKSLQQNVQAIEYLKKARLSLNTTDANYKSMLEQINQAIAKHNQALTEAGVKSQQLATRHRNLMDTAGQLSRQLALLFSVSQIEGYISKLAKVRGEFELQQRSLQAILQNKSQADQIFNKTVQLAVKSPFQIKELVTFTKQLAAYRIESDKLYDTTKRLADVSAGLGVDMGRLILAYGQVKAAAYLRGTEVRQFTEAGINMYGELQKLFKTRDQADYTTAQIVDMISKRKVTFEDVEQVFENLTSKEGIFYNMQEIQAETLQGKISNLKDSIDVMLNSIGKANEDTLKGAIDTVKVLIDNWETVVNIAKAFAPVIASMGITVWAKKIGVANGTIGLFSVGLGKAGNAMKAFGVTFKASLPLVAITAAIGIVTEFISTIKEYNKAIAESTNKYFEAKIRISTITDESESDIKKSLDKLVQEMNNEGFDIKVGVNLSEEEAKETFKNYLLEYEAFLNEQRIMEAKYAKNKSKWIVDDIDEDSEQYTSSIGEFILQGEELKAIMMQLATEENNLSAEHRKALEELSKGPKKGEDLLTYTKRMKDEVAGMWPYLSNAFNSMRLGNGMYTQEVMKARNSLTELFALSKKYIENEKEMISELESVYGSVDKYKTEAEKKRLKIRIDKSELDAVTKDLAYKHFGINISINQDSVEKETSWLDSYLKTFFEKKTYKINLNMTQPIDAKVPFEDFIKKGNEASKAAKSWEEVEKRIAAIGKNVKQIEADSKIANFLNSQNPVLNIKSGDMVDVKLILETISEYKKTQVDLSNALGVNPFENKGSKAERDIWAERISVLKEMQSRYEKLNQLMGENAAIEQTLSAFKPALEFTGMDKMNILPTKEGMIKAYEELLKDVTDSKKITELKKIIAELKIEIQQEDLKNQLETTKKNIEDLFNGLDLHKKLKNAGLSEAEVQQLFPGLAKTLDDVEKGIRDEYEAKRDKNGQLSKADQKGYDEALKKLGQQRDKESTDLTIRILKDYKTQLSEQLQLDKWYYEEKANIAKATLTDEQRAQAESNLKKKYDKKTDENTWKAFQNTDEYIKLFENLDYSSTAAIDSILEKLEKFRRSLKSLPPEQLKTIIEQLEKLKGEKLDRNPIKGIVEAFKDLKNAKPEDKQKAIADLGAAFEKNAEKIDKFNSAFGEVSSMLSSFGVDVPEEISESLNGMSQAFSGAGEFASSYATGNVLGMVTGGMKTIAGIGNTIGSIFGIGNKNKKKEREIQRQIKNIESLGRAYDELKEKMEAAWSADDLRTQTKDTIANLDQQIESYENMINSEEAKKDSDRGRIDEWNDAINELKKTRQEILDQQKLELGGIGGESEYKDAASSFVQAWMDAFNETEDGLKALNENFDSFIENLIVKQATMRLAQGRLKELFEKIDESVTEGSVGGINLTKEELANIQALGESALKGLNEDLLALMETLGYKGTSVGQKSELSALTQSIQGVSETTAEALEALLNSIRFFVNQQTTDIAAIRVLLEARYSLESQSGESNPMIVELRAQTRYLEILSDRIDRVFAPSPNSKGPALRVVMQ
ncbi:tape measure protein [Phocaeicola massiliensis]|jgi:DNA repair exonuclease SbcCD ATPase subunit|uniref:tape measure protein n=1 Tax=Phocaeicola massiliensis TaxID=204516 RepID=UPI0032EF57E7